MADDGSRGDWGADGEGRDDWLVGGTAGAGGQYDDAAARELAGVRDRAGGCRENRLTRRAGKVDTPVSREPRLGGQLEAADDGGSWCQWPDGRLRRRRGWGSGVEGQDGEQKSSQLHTWNMHAMRSLTDREFEGCGRVVAGSLRGGVVPYTSGGVPCEWDDFARPHTCAFPSVPVHAGMGAHTGRQARRANRSGAKQPRQRRSDRGARPRRDRRNTSWPS
ncbi:hypothetical protein GCM10009743_51540 [Kribbella swartbergensis]